MLVALVWLEGRILMVELDSCIILIYLKDEDDCSCEKTVMLWDQVWEFAAMLVGLVVKEEGIGNSL